MQQRAQIPENDLYQLLDTIVTQVEEIVLGKPEQIKLSVACLIAGGHLLIEDLPGVGKTTLAHTLAKVLGLELQRIQFTSDLLPADILGVSVYQRETNTFQFHPGPIFSQVILADEVNRATPKTQSALLEAMEEGQVTTEGETRLLPEPFFVIATQNPTQQIGTFPLPESQLDRFLMKINLGYLDSYSERELLEGNDRREKLSQLHSRINIGELMALKQAVNEIHISSTIYDYMQEILGHSRSNPSIQNGLSPRAGIALKKAAQSWALLNGRSYVIPEDIQKVIVPVASHRLYNNDHESLSDEKITEYLITSIPLS